MTEMTDITWKEYPLIPFQTRGCLEEIRGLDEESRETSVCRGPKEGR